jgi:hypothetical protein
MSDRRAERPEMTETKQRRITVSLSTRGDSALACAGRLGDKNQTRVVNRALGLYADAMEILDGGGKVIFEDSIGVQNAVTLL